MTIPNAVSRRFVIRVPYQTLKIRPFNIALTSCNCHYFAGLEGEHPISDAFTDPMAFICCMALNGIWKQGLSESPSTKILRREAMFLLRILPQFFCSSFCGVGSLRKKARQKGSNFVARNICTKLDLLRCRFDL